MPRRSQKAIPSSPSGSAAWGPSYSQLARAEVVVEGGGGAALALLDRQRERVPHLLEPLPLTQLAAGKAAGAERRRRLR